MAIDDKIEEYMNDIEYIWNKMKAAGLTYIAVGVAIGWVIAWFIG